jgi:DNA-binding PadR family transcriptional regulator
MPSERTELLQGTLDLIVLKLLRAGPANGWDLTQSIQVVSQGVLDVNYG